jgi:hypothetical protein
VLRLEVVVQGPLIDQALVPVAPLVTLDVHVEGVPPYVIVVGLQVSVTTGVAFVTVSITVAEVAVLTFASALTAAVIAWVPTANVEILPVAIPPLAVRAVPAVET